MENLNWLQNQRDIHNLLRRLSSNRPDAILWQNRGKDSRLVRQVVVDDFIEAKHSLVLKGKDPSQSFRFQGEKPLYFRANDKGLLLKGVLEKLDWNRILLSVPTKVLLREERKSPRIHFGALGPIDCEFSLKSEGTMVRRDFAFRLFDISCSGAALSAPLAQQKYIYEGDLLEFEMIGPLESSRNCQARVVYCQPWEEILGDRKRVYTKLGIQFLRGFQAEEIQVFDQFLS